MIAQANVQYNARRQQLQREIDHEQARVNAKSGCFKDVGSGFATIFSFGVSCIIQDQQLQALKRNRNNLEASKRRFEGDVGPQLQKLDGLNYAANRLYSSSLDKSRVVKAMENELKLQFVKFNQKKDKGRLFTRFEKLRNKMIGDLETLIRKCDQTIASSTRKNGDFLSLYSQIGGGSASSGDINRCGHNEAFNALGSNRCSNHYECDGRRRCSSSGWCSGNSGC